MWSSLALFVAIGRDQSGLKALLLARKKRTGEPAFFIRLVAPAEPDYLLRSCSSSSLGLPEVVCSISAISNEPMTLGTALVAPSTSYRKTKTPFCIVASRKCFFWRVTKAYSGFHTATKEVVLDGCSESMKFQRHEKSPVFSFFKFAPGMLWPSGQ